MIITPKLALTTTAILMAIGFLWIGFVESTPSRGTTSQGIGAAGQYPVQFIAANTIVASGDAAISGHGASAMAQQSKDNVPVLVLSATAIVLVIMGVFTYVWFQAAPAVVSVSRLHRPTVTPALQV